MRYVRSVQFGLCSIRIFFLSSFFFLFLSVFSFAETNDSQDSRDVEGINIFIFSTSTCSRISIRLEYPIDHRHFYHFLLIVLFAITRLIADKTCSLFEICILFAFSWMQLSRSY